MALIKDGKTFRNLEEQVRKNKQDIANLEKIQTVLNEFGIHVIGKVDDETQLPASSSAFGNAYAVGIQAPFEYYIWTDLQPTPGWLNIGIFPAPSNVQGPQGPDGTSVTAANIVDGYLVLTLTDADGNETQITAGYVKGAQGVQGPRGLQGLQGIQGEQGIQGLTGPQGPRGYTGWALDIISVLSDIAELPDPDTGDRHDAYVIQTGSDFELYGKVEDGDGYAWESFGLIAFSTNYVTATELATELAAEAAASVHTVGVYGNELRFEGYGSTMIDVITFAQINGSQIMGVNTNFQLTTKTEFESFQSALILGTFVVARANIAKDIEPISEASGSTQETPFIMQASGTENNTTETPVSPTARQLEKQGNSVVVNQLLVNGNFDDTSTWIGNNATFTVNAHEASMIASSQNGQLQQSFSNLISGHKYFLCVNLKLTTGTTDVRLLGNIGTPHSRYTKSNTNWQSLVVLCTANSANGSFIIRDGRSGSWDTIKVKKAFMIDLTQWFGSNDLIPTNLIDYHSTFFHYYYSDLSSYNAGTINDADGRYLKCYQSRNLWDETIKIGRYVNGIYDSSYTSNRCSNYFDVIPGATYYAFCPTTLTVSFADVDGDFLESTYVLNGVFIVPQNCYKIAFHYTGTSYNNDITITESFNTGTDYEQYYPYVEPKSYDTGTEVLRSVGSVRDIKAPDGTITRKVVKVNLGDVNWNKGGSAFTAGTFAVDFGVYKPAANEKLVVLSTERMIPQSANGVSGVSGTTEIYMTPSGGLNWYLPLSDYSDGNALKSAMQGKYAYFVLATPTTESGTPFSEVIEVNDYAPMAWMNSESKYTKIPQGCKIFYPAQYVQFIDDGVAYTNGDFTALALKDDLLPKLPSTSADETYVLKAVKSGSTITYQWIAE